MRRLEFGWFLPTAGDTTTSILPNAACAFSASARQSRSVRAGSMNTAFFWKNTGECRPDERMKWPSSSAPAARNSSRTSV